MKRDPYTYSVFVIRSPCHPLIALSPLHPVTPSPHAHPLRSHQPIDSRKAIQLAHVLRVRSREPVRPCMPIFIRWTTPPAWAASCPTNCHQGYPGRLHGGVMASMLDETLGRSVWGARGADWGVTAELTIRYKAPVPLGQMLTVVGRVTEERRRFFQAEGELVAGRWHGRCHRTGQIRETRTGSDSGANSERFRPQSGAFHHTG